MSLSKIRFVGLHFFNPVPVMKLLEVVRTEQSNSDVVQVMVMVKRLLEEQGRLGTWVHSIMMLFNCSIDGNGQKAPRRTKTSRDVCALCCVKIDTLMLFRQISIRLQAKTTKILVNASEPCTKVLSKTKNAQKI